MHDTPEFLSPVDVCLLTLKNAEINFFLTGSRFFGGSNSESDWDFIARHTEDNETFLLSIGFKPNEDVQDYLDPMTTKVLTKYFCHCEAEAWNINKKAHEITHGSECMKIDIQLCHDIDTKLKIRDILKKGFNSKPIPGDKYQRNKLWTMVYSLLKPKE